MEKQFFISIIIPVYNGSKYLNRCLEALGSSSYRSYEIIVVDDGSTDNSAEIAREHGVTVINLPQRSGPAGARNYGAQIAKGDILFFVDSDVLVNGETIARVAADFQKNPDISALFGSYDDSPEEKNFISQYKNLFHHFIHQHSGSEAMTFWAGCGAIRREVFEKIGGFDHNRYLKPSIEDIEMGFRMKKSGYRLLLDRDLQVKHLKQWRFLSFLRDDILHRAVPWSKLIIRNREMINDLNIKISHRISAGLVGLSAVLVLFSLLDPRLLYSILFCLALIFVLNNRLYRFFLNRKGIMFASLAFLMHLLYYFYSGVTFTLCRFMSFFPGRGRAGSPDTNDRNGIS